MVADALAGRRAAQQRAHARHELAHAERLGQVVVGAAVEAEHLVGLFAPRGQHQDRHVAHSRSRRMARQTRDAVEPRQHQVEHDQVERLGPRRAERLVAVAFETHAQPLELEVQLDQLADVLLVFDEQHTGARSSFASNPLLESV